MKRHTVLWSMIALSAFSGLAACGEREAAPTAAEGQASGWAVPPRIDSVALAQGTLIFRGRSQPGGRVVLRSLEGAAYAAVADDKGAFDIRMAVPTGGVVMLTPETQVGQEAAPSPQRLAILDGARGPIALLTPGAPARRLSSAPALGAVDTDGRTLLASGRGAPDGEVAVRIDDRPVVAVRTGPDGRWSLVADGGAGARQIMVEGEVFAYPGFGPAGRAGDGWRIDWAAPDGARQTTWLPDA